MRNSSVYLNAIYGPMVVAPTDKPIMITNVPMEKFTERELDELKKIDQESYEAGVKLNKLCDEQDK